MAAESRDSKIIIQAATIRKPGKIGFTLVVVVAAAVVVVVITDVEIVSST